MTFRRKAVGRITVSTLTLNIITHNEEWYFAERRQNDTQQNDKQLNDTQQNDNQQNDKQINDTQQNDNQLNDTQQNHNQ